MCFFYKREKTRPSHHPSFSLSKISYMGLQQAFCDQEEKAKSREVNPDLVKQMKCASGYSFGLNSPGVIDRNPIFCSLWSVMIYSASSLKLRVNSHHFSSLGTCGCCRQREPNGGGMKMQKRSVCLNNDQETNIELPAPGFTNTSFHLPSRTAVQFRAGLCWFRLLS